MKLKRTIRVERRGGKCVEVRPDGTLARLRVRPIGPASM
jgi:hypothetical protein